MAVDADISESKPKLPPSNAGAIPQFVVGQSYQRRSDIHLKYGGSWQNGVSSSAVCPAIFLFTGDTGEQYGYEDGFDEVSEQTGCSATGGALRETVSLGSTVSWAKATESIIFS